MISAPVMINASYERCAHLLVHVSCGRNGVPAVGLGESVDHRQLRQIQHDGERLDRRDDEAVVQVKPLGFLADGMAQQRSNTHLLRQPQGAQHGILEQPGAMPWPAQSVCTASRPSTITGIGSGMLRRTLPGASVCETAPAASA